MKDKVLNAVNHYGMLEKGDCVIIGLSGGADSCALLYSLLSLKDELGLDIRACHINHNLRGEESDEDERYVRELCEKLSVPLDVCSIDVKGNTEKHTSIEETARKLRYAEFSVLCKKYGAKLATAHTASDNAETVIMNILRGTATKGLAGIPPVRDNIIRPLINCTRADIEQYCKDNGISFVTDSTNLTDDYTRNKIRHRVIPLLTEFNPSFLEGISRMTSAVYDDNAFIESYAEEQALLCRKENGRYDSRMLSALPVAIKSRIVAKTLKENNIEPSTLRIKQCLEIIDRGQGKVNLCKNKFALVRKKFFYIETELQNYRYINR